MLFVRKIVSMLLVISMIPLLTVIQIQGQNLTTSTGYQTYTSTMIQPTVVQTTITLSQWEGYNRDPFASPTPEFKKSLGSYGRNEVIMVHYELTASVPLGPASVEIHGPAGAQPLGSGPMRYSKQCQAPTYQDPCQDTTTLSIVDSGEYYIYFIWPQMQSGTVGYIKLLVYQTHRVTTNLKVSIYSTQTLTGIQKVSTLSQTSQANIFTSTGGNLAGYDIGSTPVTSYLVIAAVVVMLIVVASLYQRRSSQNRLQARRRDKPKKSL